MGYPTELKYSKDHVWVKCDGDTATVGLTDYAVEQLGDVLFVDLPEAGKKIAKGANFTEVESSKTTSEVALPFDGEVIEANDELDDSPELLNDDAYANWIAKFKVEGGCPADLMDAAAYEASL